MVHLNWPPPAHRSSFYLVLTGPFLLNSKLGTYGFHLWNVTHTTEFRALSYNNKSIYDCLDIYRNIGVGESEDIQLFYYFIESERNPSKDPLLIWLSGGPGCSSLKGLVYEIGPVQFASEHYHGSLPKLLLNPNSWTKFVSILFIDQPVGTGFSYARNTKATHYDLMESCVYVDEFLRKWLVDHPRFISNQVYIGGDSYSGQTVPIITQFISDGNDIGLEPTIDLKGYVLGNPGTSITNNDFIPQFAYGMGLIPDELFESLKKNCRGNYYHVDPENTFCVRDMQAFSENTANIEFHHILYPVCPVVVTKPSKHLGDTRIMYEKVVSDLLIHDELHEDDKCIHSYEVVEHWTNYEIVQEAIHIRNGTIGEWKGCREITFELIIINVVPYHANLSSRGYRSLIYSGDHDMIVPSIATEAWIKSLNYSIVDDWRPWSVDGQVGGYTRTYANRMTFATVKGAGHVAPKYKPRECVSMFERWISDQPL